MDDLSMPEDVSASMRGDDKKDSTNLQCHGKSIII